MIDLQDLYARIGRDDEFTEELFDSFVADAERLITEIKQAYERRDADALRSAAHGLKGAAANLSVIHLRDEARSLEDVARGGDITGSAEAITRIVTLYGSLVEHVGSPGWLDPN